MLKDKLDGLRDYKLKREYLEFEREKLVSEMASPASRRDQRKAYEEFMQRDAQVSQGFG